VKQKNYHYLEQDGTESVDNSIANLQIRTFSFLRYFLILCNQFVTNKEYRNDFDGCYDDMSIDYDLLDSIFVQKETFGGELFADPVFQGFLKTDRDGNPRGIIALDPKDLLKLRGKWQ
jgi:hypothetical protein